MLRYGQCLCIVENQKKPVTNDENVEITGFIELNNTVP